MEAPLYPFAAPSLDFQFHPNLISSHAIPILRPHSERHRQEDSAAAAVEAEEGEVQSINTRSASNGRNTWARIDDDDNDNDEDDHIHGSGGDQQLYAVNGQSIRRDELDPFDDDEFNPFAPPSASDLAVLSGTQTIPYGSYQSGTDPSSQYPPLTFYPGADGNYDYSDDGSLMSPPILSQSTNLDQDMTPLEMLVQIIRDVSPEKIEKTFERCGYDFERTLEALMALRTSSSTLSPDTEISVPFMGDIRSTLTCRHFIQGNCFRKDCWYSHDLDSMVCKFWLKGQCLKGETCEFNHFIDTSRVVEPPAPPPKQKPPTMDDFDFPSLSASASSGKSKGSSKNGAKHNGDVKNNNANSGSNGTSKNSNRNRNVESVDALASQLEEKVKVSISSPPLLAKPKFSYSATAAAVASKPLTPLQRPGHAQHPEDTEELRRKFRLEMAPASIPWLETGSALNSEYLKSRAEAVDYAKARNRCFEMATQAYLRNDGASAAKLSAQGREYNDLMMATHREASRQIFDSRNNGQQGIVQSTGKGETWIDLHGLHVDESLAFLDEFMEKLEKEVYTGTVYVVTGTGNHSTNSRAKLKPAIVDWLESWGYVWKEMSLDKVHGGVLAVQVIKGKA
ncbi:hypothetical protein BGZ98_000549 [Dissophora globulifera]|nr:hypothetical protein BGZ98_000549 [Dissophora globulifera]